MTGNENCDVCVIGLGGSGLSAVKALQESGAQVVGIDAGDVGAGAAGRNGGFVLAGLAEFYHDEVRMLGREYSLKRYKETMHELDLLFKEYPHCTRRIGSLRLAADAKELEDCKKQFEVMKADNFPVEWYKGPEGEGLLVPTDGVFNPMVRARTLATRAKDLGARLYGKSTAIQISGKRVVTDKNCIISC